MTTSALLALAAMLSPAAAPADDGVRQDLARLQGTWKAVALEHNGKRVDFRPFVLHVRGERLLYASKAVGDFPPGSGQRFTIHPGTARAQRSGLM